MTEQNVMTHISINIIKEKMPELRGMIVLMSSYWKNTEKKLNIYLSIFIDFPIALPFNTL